MANIGDRVLAILGSEKQADGTYIVKSFGLGTYAGQEVPTTAVGWLAAAAREEGITNPKIELDSGGVVWGCECWFGPEAAVLKRIGDLLVIHVDVDEWRESVREAEAAEAEVAL